MLRFLCCYPADIALRPDMPMLSLTARKTEDGGAKVNAVSNTPLLPVNTPDKSMSQPSNPQPCNRAPHAKKVVFDLPVRQPSPRLHKPQINRSSSFNTPLPPPRAGVQRRASMPPKDRADTATASAGQAAAARGYLSFALLVHNLGRDCSASRILSLLGSTEHPGDIARYAPLEQLVILKKIMKKPRWVEREAIPYIYHRCKNIIQQWPDAPVVLPANRSGQVPAHLQELVPEIPGSKVPGRTMQLKGQGWLLLSQRILLEMPAERIYVVYKDLLTNSVSLWPHYQWGICHAMLQRFNRIADARKAQVHDLLLQRIRGFSVYQQFALLAALAENIVHLAATSQAIHKRAIALIMQEPFFSESEKKCINDILAGIALV